MTVIPDVPRNSPGDAIVAPSRIRAGSNAPLATAQGSARASARKAFTAAPVASFGAAQLAAQGIVAALLRRERTGRGDHVATSLLQGAMAFVALPQEEAQQALMRSQRIAGLAVATAGVAHEMNNPLTGVLGLAQVLATRLRRSEGHDGEVQMVTSIVDEAKRHLTKKGGLLCEVGRGRNALERAYPRTRFLWLDTEASEGEVFWLAASDCP